MVFYKLGFMKASKKPMFILPIKTERKPLYQSLTGTNNLRKKSKKIMNKYKFSLITSAILVLGSFVPVLQVLILTANGAFISIFTNENTKVILLVNGIMSLIMFTLFYFSNMTITKVISVLGLLLFFIPFLFYATEKIISVDKYYFLQFLIIGIVTGVLLMLIEIIKTKAAY